MSYGVEIHGPFLPQHFVTLGGYRVPYITATPVGDDLVDIVLDNRFSLPAPILKEEFERWIYLLANAMAIAAGYSCHGDNCQPTNPFQRRMGQLIVEPEKPTFTIIEGGKEGAP